MSTFRIACSVHCIPIAVQCTAMGHTWGDIWIELSVIKWLIEPYMNAVFATGISVCCSISVHAVTRHDRANDEINVRVAYRISFQCRKTAKFAYTLILKLHTASLTNRPELLRIEEWEWVETLSFDINITYTCCYHFLFCFHICRFGKCPIFFSLSMHAVKGDIYYKHKAR